jgi:outer membrane protein
MRTLIKVHQPARRASPSPAIRNSGLRARNQVCEANGGEQKQAQDSRNERRIELIKKLTLRLSWLLLLLAGSAAAELKIAVLDTQRALLASEEAQSLLAQAAEELQTEEAGVKKLGEEILAIQEKLQTDGEVMSPTEQRRLAKDIEDNQIDYQFRLNKLQKAVNDRRQELLAQMVPKIEAVLKDLIALEGYDLVMERANLRYVNSKHDITLKVTEKLNERQ